MPSCEMCETARPASGANAEPWEGDRDCGLKSTEFEIEAEHEAGRAARTGQLQPENSYKSL